ncbi:hypothetical protein NX059_007602 [Plenodomus lindquistii]|nr:hypothetical protein NX059_007602 [Plenodomus lindquistii]
MAASRQERSAARRAVFGRRRRLSHRQDRQARSSSSSAAIVRCAVARGTSRPSQHFMNQKVAGYNAAQWLLAQRLCGLQVGDTGKRAAGWPTTVKTTILKGKYYLSGAKQKLTPRSTDQWQHRRICLTAPLRSLGLPTLQSHLRNGRWRLTLRRTTAHSRSNTPDTLNGKKRFLHGP